MFLSFNFQLILSHKNALKKIRVIRQWKKTIDANRIFPDTDCQLIETDFVIQPNEIWS